jgi:hypothetical protein
MKGKKMPPWAQEEWRYLLRVKLLVLELSPTYQRNRRLQEVTVRMKELSKIGE